MRITPLAVWGYQLSEEQLVQATREDAQLTHPNQTCQVGKHRQPRQLSMLLFKSFKLQFVDMQSMCRQINVNRCLQTCR